MLAEMAVEAEKSGWGGFFLWDHVVEWDRRVPICDSFTVLAAIAVKTKRICIGTTVTPLRKNARDGKTFKMPDRILERLGAVQ